MASEARNIPESEPIPDYYFVYRFLPNALAYGGGTWDFARTYRDRCVCPDCDAHYDAATWVEDEDSDHNPMLVCACGGQMYSTKEG